MAENVEDLRKHIRFYIGIFGALIALTVLTVVVSYLPFNEAGHVAVALLIATVKAALVAFFFMHLASEKRMIYRVLIFAGAFVLALVVLSLLAMHDHVKV